MALSPRLELKHSQTLVMTPQLQQAIKLLQYTNLELGDFVAQEVEKNPLLEMGEPAAERSESEGGEEPAAIVADGATTADQLLTEPVGAVAEALDTSFDNVFDPEGPGDGAIGDSGLGLNGIAGGSGGFDDFSGDFEQNLAAAPSLRSHLEAQLADLRLTPGDQMIAHFLVDMVDDAGYLRDDLAVVTEKLACDMEDVERVLRQCQGLDPAGVFARDLKECLAIQLREHDRLDPAMEALLDNLDMLARRDLAGLRRICGVDAEDLAEMIMEIQALDPKPGLAHGAGEVQPILPDVFVRRGPKGQWIVELNTETLPRVLMNTSYHAEIAGRARSREDKAFVSECFHTANWLIKALDQRAKTILKVASEIVRHQENFFLEGVRHLRPLNLRTIADAIEMHESTVSRVTTNKYLACERGIFELKYFFTSAINAAGDGEAHSAEAVKHRIKELIDGEDPEKILSDDRIVEILREQGVDIARRTVAKYREALKIPSSIQRRRQKAPVV